MEYQKITNLLDDATNESSKFRIRNLVEINDESRGTNLAARDTNQNNRIKKVIIKNCAPFVLKLCSN